MPTNHVSAIAFFSGYPTRFTPEVSGEDSESVAELLVGEVVFAEHVDEHP